MSAPHKITSAAAIDAITQSSTPDDRDRLHCQICQSNLICQEDGEGAISEDDASPPQRGCADGIGGR